MLTRTIGPTNLEQPLSAAKPPGGGEKSNLVSRLPFLPLYLSMFTFILGNCSFEPTDSDHAT